MSDPKTHRMIQTRDGVAEVPRTQEGVPLKEYFQNTELPADLERAVVYVTPKGPALAKPDPVPWTEAHDRTAEDYAAKLKELIDERGYYSKTLGAYAGRLADATGYARDEMKALIVSKFDAAYGREPFDYLQDQREAKGLPVREREEPAPDQGPEPEI